MELTTSMEMILVIGLPGAGKSSYVQSMLEHNWKGSELICFDELRRALGHAYHATTEPHVQAVACTLARLAFMRGRDVVVDESITMPGVAMDLVSIAREYSALVRMRHICTPVDVCRANRVPHAMPAADFDRKLGEWQMWGKFILNLCDEKRNLEGLYKPEVVVQGNPAGAEVVLR